MPAERLPRFPASCQVTAVQNVADLKAAVILFEAYAQSLGIDLSFQDFKTEMATMPGKYAPPLGALLLARNNEGEAVGCVALRPLEPNGCCEMKRLYVAPAGRGLGTGQALVDAILKEAMLIGYSSVCLDTLPTMVEAISLYEKFGFIPIEPYYNTPLADTVFLGRALQ